MPYWNRSLIVIPREGAPVLLCAAFPAGLSVDQVGHHLRGDSLGDRNLAALDQLCSERGWSESASSILPKLPVEIRAGLGGIEAVNVPSAGVTDPDDAEFPMRRKAREVGPKAIEGDSQA